MSDEKKDYVEKMVDIPIRDDLEIVLNINGKIEENKRRIAELEKKILNPELLLNQPYEK